jgi:hypothetical protein
VDRMRLFSPEREMEDERDYEESYQERLFHSRHQRGNHGKIVDVVALRVAKAAFSSPKVSMKFKRYYFDGGLNILEWAKSLIQRPGFKEGVIIGSVMLSKMALWFAYRQASENGLEIVDL